MLIIEQYGVRLVRLQKSNIELVRYWRNQSDIANYMEYRNYITPSAQINWFDSINNKNNYYFIIEYQKKKVGLINSKDYNPKYGFGEGGIFIWDKSFIDSYVAVFSTLCLLNFVFFTLKLPVISTARILKSNHKAINYNKQIGYKLLPNQELIENQLYELTFEEYQKHASVLNNAAAQLNKDNSVLKYEGKVSDKNIDQLNLLLSKANH